MRIARRLLGVLLFAGLFFFAWRFTHANTTPVAVDLVLGRTPEVPLWVLLLAALAVGAALAGAVLAYALARKSLLARRYRKAVVGLEKEIHQLRNLPLAEGRPEAPPADAAAGSGPGR